MELNGNKSSIQDEESAKALEQLGRKLRSDNSSIARKTAYNLSWLQEDGLEVLKKALFTSNSRRTKHASAYGMRSMRGRMKKQALEVLEEGLRHSNSIVRDICNEAMRIMKGQGQAKSVTGKSQQGVSKVAIRSIPRKKRGGRPPIHHEGSAYNRSDRSDRRRR
jgi:U3 small nucleolar ribonucleoprotein component